MLGKLAAEDAMSNVTRTMRLALAATLLALMAAAACGGEGEDGSYEEFAAPAAPQAASGPAAMAMADAPSQAGVAAEASAAPAAARASAVAEAGAAPAAKASFAVAEQGVDTASEQAAQLVSQQRIIVRTVDMGIEVDDVGAGIDAIADAAQSLGGWVVSSNRPQQYSGSISFRVPANMLDQAVQTVRRLALDVQFESSTSKDVTDEYVDLSSRLTNLRATEAALLRLMERAEKVEEALDVQESLTETQGNVERLEGRIKFLEQTSAFSLVNVTLNKQPGKMRADAGPDLRAGVGEPARFRASFNPPADIDRFEYTWDFGDGNAIAGSRTGPTENEGERVTATVNHIYDDEKESPYIVQFQIRGFGDGGVVEGEDTLTMSVFREPNIEVFAGDWVSVEAGEEVELSGSFTRPAGMSDVRFTWDFGDGSEPAVGSMANGVTTAVARYAYQNHRPAPYMARLTITGKTATGAVEGSSAVEVSVREAEGWVIAGWSLADQAKTAVRTLTTVTAASATAGIWLLVFSPVIAAILGAAIFLGRRAGASQPRRPKQAAQGETAASPDDAPIGQ